jgi:hypothetical protein
MQQKGADMAGKPKDIRLQFRATPDEKAAIEAFAVSYGYKDPANLARVAIFGLIAQMTGKPLMGGE